MSLPVMPLNNAAEYSLYARIEAHILSAFPDATVRHTKTQSAFTRTVQFCWVTPPQRKADAGGIMIYIALPFPLDSPRVLRVSSPSPERHMHQILLHDESEFDPEIMGWIEAAWALVGPGRRRS